MITDGRLLGAARSRKCPSCGGPLIPGPRGGASQNFYCTACHEGWNLHGIDYGILGLERIGKVDDALIEFYLGAAAGEEIRRDQLKASGLDDEEVEAMLRMTRMGMPFPPMRQMLKGDGFTDEQIDELFAFAQIVEPSGNVVHVSKATLPELRGIMGRLFPRGDKDDEQL